MAMEQSKTLEMIEREERGPFCSYTPASEPWRDTVKKSNEKAAGGVNAPAEVNTNRLQGE